MPIELIDRFLYEGKIGFTLIKIQLCEVKVFLMRIGPKTPATSKLGIFMTIVKEWKLSKIVINSSILDATLVLDPV